MAMGHILRMNPVFKEMIWGGTKLKDIYGYEIPSDHTGECWAISAHKNGDCTIAENIKEKHYPGYLKTTENYLEISKETSSHYL